MFYGSHVFPVSHSRGFFRISDTIHILLGLNLVSKKGMVKRHDGISSLDLMNEHTLSFLASAPEGPILAHGFLSSKSCVEFGCADDFLTFISPTIIWTVISRLESIRDNTRTHTHVQLINSNCYFRFWTTERMDVNWICPVHSWRGFSRTRVRNKTRCMLEHIRVHGGHELYIFPLLFFFIFVKCFQTICVL